MAFDTMDADDPRGEPICESAMRLAFAALIATQDSGPTAVHHCRRHRMRALRALAEGDELAMGAIGVLRLGCAVCGRCTGISLC